MQMAKYRGEDAMLRGVTVRNANDLQAINFDLFIGEHANARCGNGIQVFAVVAELFVIAGDEVDATRGSELGERLRRTVCVDRGAVVKIAADEDRVGRFFENFGNQAAKEISVANVTEVEIGDESRFASTPGLGQVRKANGGASNARPACIEDPEQTNQGGGREENLDGAMEVHHRSKQIRNRKNDPGQNRREKQETKQAHPDSGSAIKNADGAVRITKRQKGSGDEADGQKENNALQPGSGGAYVACGGKDPGLIEEKMRKEQNRLNDRKEDDQSSKSHENWIR